ncbi:MAG: Dihydrofolate reductase [Verrucomicrobia bacterium ADurb.Bin474]|nr:MAG: Dihydrofolate reductase [Verrucomicrobia bacterium ADurb.Bin474]
MLSRDPSRTFSGCDKAPDLHSALRMADAADGYDTIWIGGGQALYEEALPLIDRLYLTLVHTEVPDGDTFFPEWRNRFTKVVSSRRSTNGKLDYTFLVLEPA